MTARHDGAVGDARKRQTAQPGLDANPAAERIRAEGRHDALVVVGGLLDKLIDYWDGRPLRLHGDHIYADIADITQAVHRDAEIARRAAGGGET